MSLEFVNNLLVSLRFAPNDASKYENALKVELGRSIDAGEVIQIGDVLVSSRQTDGRLVVTWTNTQLNNYSLSGG